MDEVDTISQNKNMMQYISAGTKILFALALLDLFILVMAIAQVAAGEQTGYWSPFWFWQAQHLVALLQF